MKTKTTLRVLALALCLCLALSGCGFDFPFDIDLPGLNQQEEEHQPDRERRTIPYAEMEYTRPDIEAVGAQLDALTAQAAQADDIDALMALDEEAGALIEVYDTMHSLAFLRAHLDVNDRFYNDELRLLDEAEADMSLKRNAFNTVLVEGPLAADYRRRVGDYLFEAVRNSLLLNSEAVKEYKRERDTLYLDYNDWLNSNTVSHGGAEYTLDEISDVDSSVLQSQLLQAYYAQHAQSYATLYARMVELDKLTAQALGFEDAATMYYLSHGRDYSPADAQAICNEVKENFVPLLQVVMAGWYDAGSVAQADTLDFMPGALGQIDPELAEAWDYMRQYGLYSFDAAAGKSTTMQFTTHLPAYDAPYIFTYWRDDFTSASTIAHEFGHFYDNYLWYDTDISACTDVAEIYSQTLELLMHPLYGELTEYAEEAQLSSLQSMFFSAIMVQCLYEEFQLRIYQLDSFDATIAGRLFAELLGEYGLIANTDEYGADHGWFSVGHLFYSPFYTISYATSAAAALQVWAQSRTDWDGAVDTYLKLIHTNQNQPFAALLKSAGLKPVQQKGMMKEIAGYFRDEFGGAGLGKAA